MTRNLMLLLLATALSSEAQRLTVVLDPSRGGTEYGARIDEHTYEKQVTLDVANRLRFLLTARDFNVVLTRDSDVLVTNEERAAAANTAKPLACILLHATAAGTGVHLWSSSLNPTPAGMTAVLWDEAQSPFVQRSQRLSAELGAAFTRGNIALSSGRTWIRPLDNMQCPAVAVEIAPRNSDLTAGDRNYQNEIANSIANQLLLWRNHADVVQSVLNPPPPPAPPKAEVKTDGKAGESKAGQVASKPNTAAKAATPKTDPATAKAAPSAAKLAPAASTTKEPQ